MPLFDLFWAMLWFFLFFAWIWLLISIFGDIFRSNDMGGWGKALWTLFVIILPLLGTLIYLIARGGSMAERSIEAAREQDAAMQAYIKEAAAGSASSADELKKLAELRSSGVISDQEFEAQKAKLLA